MPKSYLSEEEKIGLDHDCLCAAESQAADDAGDEDTAWEWLRLAEIPAYALMAAKQRNGADWIKKMGLRTETAEKAYGPNWLEKHI
jgi:hypothetical protein